MNRGTQTRRGVRPAVDPDRWPEVAVVPSSLRARGGAPIARALLLRAVADLPLRVIGPDGAVLGGRGAADGPTMVVRNPDALYARLATTALIGFGESYMAGEWDSPDLAALLTVLAGRMAELIPQPVQQLRRWFDARHPEQARNLAENARANVSHHYDLSNDLFAMFLDESLTYSAALFPDLRAALPPTATGTRVSVSRPRDHPVFDDLAAAQLRKIDRLLDAAAVTQGSSVLEIGSGWGALAIRAAARGARVHTITLSTEQLRLAQERVAAAGVADRVELELIDYRAVTGRYDAVVSCEMIEAVGYEFMSDYFAAIDARLRPGGRAAVQAITMPHDRMLATRHTYTWITKYIFPGGFIPSSELIETVTAEQTALQVVERFRMGAHYAETLRLWHERFEQMWPHIRQLRTRGAARADVDDVFRLMWLFYLDYSRAGFASGYLDVQQIAFVKAP